MRSLLPQCRFGVLLAALLLAAGLGQAQPTGTAATAGQAAQEEQPPPPEGKFVEDVVVTAQKREENVQEVPVAMTALTGEDLGVIMTAGPDIRFLSARVPSLVLESSFGRAFPRFYMRGLGNTDFDLNASQPVSMVVDEVVLENPIVKGMPLFDLDRVEILRGPQGTLFGRNTPAGVVKFDTKKPTREFDAAFRVSYGTFDTFDLNGGVGGPITDTLSYRFSALYQSRSDWVENRYEAGPEEALGGYENSAYRLQLLWQPTEDLSALFNLHGWKIDGTARIFRANILRQGSNRLADWFEQDEIWHDGKNEQDISSLGSSVKIDYNLGGATLTSITGYESIDDMYSRGDIDGGYGAVFLGEGNYGPGTIPFPSESADGIPSLSQLTQEVRLASNGSGSLRWLVGAYYFAEDLSVDSFSYDSLTPGNPQNGHATQEQEATSYALFGSVGYRVGDRWSLQAGLRYSHDEKDFVADRPQPLFQPPLTAPIRRQVDGSNVSGDLSATYKASETVNVFTRLATGYRAPSIQGRIMFAPDFENGQNPATNGVSVADEEKIKSFEVGMKSILAERRLRLNLTGYLFRMDGQQLTAVGGQYNVATLLNADRTNGHGFEADVQYVASEHFWVTLGASWNHTEIDDANLTVAPCGGGCTITDPRTADGLVLIDGNPLPHAPEWIFNGVLDFQSDPLAKGFFGALDWAYFSEKNFFLYESKEFKSDSLEFGLRLGYGWNKGRREVALYARNLLDRESVEGGIDFNNLTGYTNEPRIVGIEFVGRF